MGTKWEGQSQETLIGERMMERKKRVSKKQGEIRVVRGGGGC